MPNKLTACTEKPPISPLTISPAARWDVIFIDWCREFSTRQARACTHETQVHAQPRDPHAHAQARPWPRKVAPMSPSVTPGTDKTQQRQTDESASQPAQFVHATPSTQKQAGSMATSATPATEKQRLCQHVPGLPQYPKPQCHEDK